MLTSHTACLPTTRSVLHTSARLQLTTHLPARSDPLFTFIPSAVLKIGESKPALVLYALSVRTLLA